MTLQRFGEILDAFGSDPNAWPESERATCVALVDADAAARALLQEHVRLEQALDALTVPAMPSLAARVLHQQLPARETPLGDRILQWMLPANRIGVHLWRPALAACLPLVFGVLVGNYFSFGITGESPGFEYWDDELYMLSLNDYTENLDTE